MGGGGERDGGGGELSLKSATRNERLGTRSQGILVTLLRIIVFTLSANNLQSLLMEWAREGARPASGYI